MAQPTPYDSPLYPILEAAPENTGKGFYVIVSQWDNQQTLLSSSVSRVKDQEIAAYALLTQIEKRRVDGYDILYVDKYLFVCEKPAPLDDHHDIVGVIIRYA